MSTPPERILVVDDEEDVRTLISRLLSDAGYKVEAAGGGAEALERLKADGFDLVVLDIMMPEMDGWAVLDQMRATGHPAVVILTASGEYDTFSRGVGEGAAAYVRKPFRFDDLLATCQRVLKARASKAPPVGRERRREERRPLLVAVTVLSKDKTPLALGELVNLSPGGAQVELGVPLAPGSRVWVAFQGTGMSLTLECEVRWWQGSASRSVAHGLSFLNLTPEQERPIRELLSPRGEA